MSITIVVMPSYIINVDDDGGVVSIVASPAKYNTKKFDNLLSVRTAGHAHLTNTQLKDIARQFTEYINQDFIGWARDWEKLLCQRKND